MEVRGVKMNQQEYLVLMNKVGGGGRRHYHYHHHHLLLPLRYYTTSYGISFTPATHPMVVVSCRATSFAKKTLHFFSLVVCVLELNGSSQMMMWPKNWHLASKSGR